MSEFPSQHISFLTRHRPAIALTGVFTAYFAFNVFASISSVVDDGLIGFSVSGVVVSEPMMLGMWTALAEGSVLTRLPIAAACSMVLFLAPALSPAAIDSTRFEFVITVAAGLLMFAVTMLMFLLARGSFQIRNRPAAQENRTGTGRIYFSTKYLLALISIYALMLGMTSQLSFRNKQGPELLAPDFFLGVIIVGAPVAYATLLPILLAPLLVLYRGPHGRVIRRAFVFWAFTSSFILAISAALKLSSFPGAIAVMLMFQSGAFIAGTLAAMALRRDGIVLVKIQPPGQIPMSAAP